MGMFSLKQQELTTSYEIKLLVQQKLRLDEISIKTRKREYVFARYVAIALAIRFTNESYNVIGKTLRIDHSSITHGYQEFQDLLGQKIFQNHEYVYNQIFHELDLRKRKAKKIEPELGLEELKQKHAETVWKMATKNHSIRKKLLAKIEALENEVENLKNMNYGNLQE